MEKSGMDAVLAKLGKRLGRKPMLKRKGLTDSGYPKAPGMTVVIGVGKPMDKPMGERGAMAKRDEKGYPMDEREDESEPMDEMEPESMNAKLDALMERIDALEAKLAKYEGGDEGETDDMEEEED